MESILNNPKIKTGSMDLLFAIIASAVNILGLFLNIGFYFPFSVYLPYVVSVVGYGSAHPELIGETETVLDPEIGNFILIFSIVIAAIILGVYLLLFFLSRPGRVKTVDQAKGAKATFVVALVLFCIDTLFLIFMGIGFLGLSALIDVAFHIWAIVSLVGGIKGYNAAIKEAMSPTAVVEAEATVVETEAPAFDDNQNI